MKIAGIVDSAVSAIRQRQVDRWLNPKESVRLRSLDASVTIDWLAGRVALKQAYLDERRSDPTSFVVSNSLSGVPYIGERSETFCSIGHRAGWGIGGVSDQPIGVDIEKIGTQPESLLPYICANEELAEMMFDGDSPDVLVTMVWTLKESAMKAWRTGLKLHPKLVGLSRQDANTFTIRSRHPSGHLPLLNAVVYTVNDFVISVAFEERVTGTPTIHWVDTPIESVSQ
jgi:phosphopantetheinyl transferase